jgi:DNA-binding transcriptional LysR family regulator
MAYAPIRVLEGHRITQEPAEGKLVRLRLDVPRPPVEISVAWQRSNTGKGLKWFVDHLNKMRFDADRGILSENPAQGGE